jgi:phage head maturation protease
MEELTQDQQVDIPPRDDLVRIGLPLELTRTTEDGMPTLHGVGAVYGEWTEIGPSRVEGHFMERFAGGSFKKTIQEGGDRIRCIFHHGQDPSIGVKVLGPLEFLGERGRGVEYDVPLLDTDYNRALVPGLEAGLYGSSFRFGIIKKDDERRRVSNEKGLLERTIREASMRELGPTPFPAYGGTTAGVRSLTDTIMLGRFPAEDLVAEAAIRSNEPDLVGEMRLLAERFLASDETDAEAMRAIVSMLDEIKTTPTEETTAPSPDAVPTGTSELWRAAKDTSSTPLWGLDRDEEEVTPAWRL